MELIIKVIYAIIFLTSTTKASRILAVFPYPSHSHTIIQHEVTVALADEGHELTVFTTNPMNSDIPNYTEYSLQNLYDVLKENVNFVEVQENGLFFFFKKLYDMSATIANKTFSHPEMQKILSSSDRKNKFDLIILSVIKYDSLFYLSDLLDAPVVGISSIPGLPTQYHIMGNPLSLSYVPDSTLAYTDEMTFWQRLHNFYHSTRLLYEYYTINLPKQEQVLKSHFGNNVPPIRELSNRLNMMFINTHPFFDYPRPLVPGIIQIGGLRYGRLNNTLPKDLKTLLDNSKQGFIYFSLGSNIKSIHLRENTLKSFIDAFAELPYQIIWKFETNTLEGKPDNVHIEKWLPQQGILAHPNLKLFVYQGGLQSSEEAISNGVPMLGCPFFADQWYNLNILTKRGAAKSLDVNSISKEKIKDAIYDIISNNSYRENTIKLRDLLMDLPQPVMTNVIWWIEHVIRHKGAKHLRVHSLDMPWYQVEQLDIFGFFLGVLIVLFLLTWMLFRLIFSLIKAYTPNFIKNMGKKSSSNKKHKSS